METSMFDLTSQTKSRKDLNGEPCALIKVQLPMSGAIFEGSIIGDVVNTGGEYWVYVKKETKNIQIKHPYIHPYMVNFGEYLNEPLQGNVTYNLVITVFGDDLNLSELRKSMIKTNDNEPNLKSAISILEDNGKSDKSEAIRLLKKSSDSNNISALLKLAECYESGVGIEQDYEEAADIYKQLVKTGNTYAKLRLAEHYLQGTGVVRNESKGLAYMKEAADSNSPEAAYKIGEFYQNGIFFDRDDSLAFKYFTLACKNGYPDAYYKLGHCYEYGFGVEQNFPKSMSTYFEGVEKGSSKSMNRLGQIYSKGQKFSWLEPTDDGMFILHSDSIQKDLVKSVKYFRMAIDCGDLYAMNNLAILISDQDIPGTKKSDAMNLIMMSAQRGNSVAQLNLAVNLYAGNMIDKDVYEAGIWFRRAADQGQVDSQIVYGRMLLGGIGTVPNIDEAVSYYKKAADNENSTGEFMMGIFYDLGLGVTQDVAKALDYYKKASLHMVSYNKYARMIIEEFSLEGQIQTRNHLASTPFLSFNTIHTIADQNDSFFNWLLGYIYSTGLYVDKDNKKAVKYYTRASTLGDARSKFELSMIYCYDEEYQDAAYGSLILNLVKEAAEEGYAMAEYSMGIFYQNGFYGLDENEDIATQWYEKSIKHGYNPLDNIAEQSNNGITE